jgi:hypothetical protein
VALAALGSHRPGGPSLALSGDGMNCSEGDAAAAVAFSPCALPYSVPPVSLFLHGLIRCFLRSDLLPQHRLFINFTGCSDIAENTWHRQCSLLQVPGAVDS